MVQLWAIEVFDKKPVRAGYWKFTWEAGHGSWQWTDVEVHFDAARQRFVEKLTTRPYPGFAQVHCELDTASLTNFLQRMRNVAPEGIDSKWLQGLIAGTPPNRIIAAGMVPSFDGTQESLTLTFQTSAGGAIGIDFTTVSGFAAALRPQLRTWCTAN